MTQDGSVFISSLLDEERMPLATSNLVFGQSHYSWKLIARLYTDGLSRAGIRARPIARPEIYQAPVARDVLKVTSQDMHIAVKQVEHLRPFYGLPNLFVCGWEFPEFYKGSLNHSPFLKQLAVLNRADRVLCWTDFTRDNLLAQGVSQAVTLPPPILPQAPGNTGKVAALSTICLSSKHHELSPKDIKTVPFNERMATRKDPVLLAILNPHDKRKVIDTLLQGALMALAEGHKFTLVIKLVIDGTATRLVNINELLHQRYGFYEESDQIVFCAGDLDEQGMAALRAGSDFHISASSAEGLNLPLVESALQNIPVITTHNTAMASYLGADDAVWIACDAAPATNDVNAFANDAEFTYFPPPPNAIAKAIGVALDLPSDARANLANRGRSAVEARFGQARFESDFLAIAQEVLA